MRRLIRWPLVQNGVPYTRQHVLRLEKAGLFPKRVRIGGNAVAWFEDEIAAWQEEHAEQRDNQPSEKLRATKHGSQPSEQRGDEPSSIKPVGSGKPVGSS